MTLLLRPNEALTGPGPVHKVAARTTVHPAEEEKIAYGGQPEATGEDRGQEADAAQRSHGGVAWHAESRRLGGVHRHRHQVQEADPGRSRLRAEGEEPAGPHPVPVQEG